MTLLFAAGVALNSWAFIDSYTIKREQLPETAQEMLQEHFPKAKVSNIKIDRHLLKKTDYDVKLTDGTVIEFSSSGKWTSVQRKRKAVPEALIPKSIRKYMANKHSDSKVTGLKKKPTFYFIDIDDGRRLKFNLTGQFKGFVDSSEADNE